MNSDSRFPLGCNRGTFLGINDEETFCKSISDFRKVTIINMKIELESETRIVTKTTLLVTIFSPLITQEH